MKNIVFRGSFSLQRKLLVLAALAVIILPLASCSSFKDFFVNAKESIADENDVSVEVKDENGIVVASEGGIKIYAALCPDDVNVVNMNTADGIESSIRIEEQGEQTVDDTAAIVIDTKIQ